MCSKQAEKQISLRKNGEREVVGLNATTAPITLIMAGGGGGGASGA